MSKDSTKKAPVKGKKAGAGKEKEKKPTIFSMLVDALRAGPQTTDQLAKIIVKGSSKMDDVEKAKKTVPVRIYNLKKQGYEIDGTAKEGKFTLKKEPKPKK